MLLRCSKCKGSFEIEPNPHKAVVFCSHCGAPLQIRGMGPAVHKAKAPERQSLAALTQQNEETETTMEEEVEVDTTPAPEPAPAPTMQYRARPSMPAGSRNFSQAVSAPASDEETSSADPLAALASASSPGPRAASRPGAVSRPGATSQSGRPGPKKKKSSGNGILIGVLIGGGVLVIGIVVVVAVVIMTNQPKPVKQKVYQPQAGELFKDVKPEGEPPAP